MKINGGAKTVNFKPVSVTIEFETKEELGKFWVSQNLSDEDLNEFAKSDSDFDINSWTDSDDISLWEWADEQLRNIK